MWRYQKKSPLKCNDIKRSRPFNETFKRGACTCPPSQKLINVTSDVCVHKCLNLWRTNCFSFGYYYVIAAAIMIFDHAMSLFFSNNDFRFYLYRFVIKIVFTTAISIKFCHLQLSNFLLRGAEQSIIFLIYS